MEKVIRDGKVAILYSPGFGAGWYTWNTEHPDCIFNPKLVALVESGDHFGVEKLAESLYGDSFYTGGAIKLKIKWVPVGNRFDITEYYGSERVVIYDELPDFIA